MSQVRGVIPLFVVSYLIHAMLLVNSAETELLNHQRPIGELLSEQLATSAAPFIINKDSVGLGLLANHFGDADAVLNLRIIDNQNQVLATGGQAKSQKGLNFSAPIILEKQRLGVAQIALSSPERGEIIKHSSINLALSFMVHLFLMLWVGWPQLFKEIRVPILQSLVKKEEPTPEPLPIKPEPIPEPVKPAASVWVNFSFDDPRGLMQKVNANTLEQFLQIVDKLIKRTTRLYTGKAITTLNSEGISIRFDGDTVADCAHRALLSSRLLIKLATTAHTQRREAKQFSVKLKAAILNLGELTDEAAHQQLKTVLTVVKVNQIFMIDDDILLAQWKDKHQLSAFEPAEDSSAAHKKIKAHFIESLATDLEDELSALEKRILERKKAASVEQKMSDFNAIETLITQYFKGLHSKNINAVAEVFWSHAEITGYYEGDFVHSKLHDYLSILKRMSAPNMIGEEFEMHISSIDIIGNIASVKTRYVFQALNYVDFLSLVKIDDVWKIVNKVFYHD